MQKIIPHVWCQGTAEEAVAFYRNALPDCTLAGSSRYPSEGLPDFQQKFAGELLTADLRIGATTWSSSMRARSTTPIRRCPSS